MNEMQITVSELEDICRLQYEEIENKKLQIWDVEEENRVLHRSLKEKEETIATHVQRIYDLEAWCTHLQSIIDKNAEEMAQREEKYQVLEKKLGIFFRIARKIKQWLVG